jgi:hypothetical protein
MESKTILQIIILLVLLILFIWFAFTRGMVGALDIALGLGIWSLWLALSRKIGLEV